MLAEGRLKKQLLRFLLTVVTFSIGVSLALLFRVATTREVVPPISKLEPGRAEKDRSDEILSVLLPNGTWGDASQLQGYKRDEVVKALKIAERDASGDRVLAIAFLLAAVGEDYQVNKSKLLDELETCRSKPYPDASQCADFVAGYLIELGRRGDPSVLPPLFAVTDMADGDFAESLGDFYSDALIQYPKEFLTALKPYSPNEQQHLCGLAGLLDGSGMSDEEYRDAKRFLNQLSNGQDSSIAKLVKKCLSSIQSTRTSTADGIDQH